MAKATDTAQDIAHRVAESRARQGLPPRVQDAATLRRLADLLQGKPVMSTEPPSPRAIAVMNRRRLRAEDARRARHRLEQLDEAYVERRWSEDLAKLTDDQRVELLRMQLSQR